jgi:UDP-N-acetyl-D-mannosaminuronate dehydrogenase
VLVLGVAYKKDIDDLRESPALDIIRLLERLGAKVQYHDPFIAELHEEGVALKSTPLTADAVRAADCVMIVTDHSTLDYAMVQREARALVDTRHAVASRSGAK